MTAALAAGCKGKDDSSAQPAKDTHRTLAKRYTIDGVMSDWPQETLVLAEAGAVGTKFPNAIDVKQVHVDNDGNFLYVFLQCKPTPAQRHKIEQSTHGIATLLFDVDNDRTTGSKGATVHFHPDKQDGLEIRLSLQISVGVEWTPGGGTQSIYSCGWKLARWDPAKLEFVDIDDKQTFLPWSTENTPDLIADGPDGVEFCIPLSQLGLFGLQPGATIRILLKEDSNCWDEKGFREVTIVLKQ